MITFTQASINASDRRNDLLSAMSMKADNSQLMYYRGRYIAALQAQIKAAKNEGQSYSSIQSELNSQLNSQRMAIKNENTSNKRVNYSMVKEFSLGLKSLVNSARMMGNANTQAEKTRARKEFLSSLGNNLKNIVKAPVVLATRLLSSSLAAWVIFTPINLGMGVLHAAWTALDDKKSPYDNSGVQRMSNGFQNLMKNINTKVKGL